MDESSSFAARRRLGRDIGEWCTRNDFPVEALNRAVAKNSGIEITIPKLDAILAGKVAPSDQEVRDLMAAMRDLDESFPPAPRGSDK